VAERFSPLFVVAGALVLVCCGCGGTGKTLSLGPARLLVEQTIDTSGGIPIEGEYSYVRVDTPDGDKVVEEQLHSARPWHAKATISLQPGTYKLVSYQRLGSGSSRGSPTDPPSHFCSSKFRISGELGVKVLVNFSSGCSISWASASG
jgi:hypothetical protein